MRVQHKLAPFVLLFVLIGLAFLGYSHYTDLVNTNRTPLAVLFGAMFLYFTITAVSSLSNGKFVYGGPTDHLTVDVVIPIYNEDPSLLAADLAALVKQTRLPRAVYLIDDGSTKNLPLGNVDVLVQVVKLRDLGVKVIFNRKSNGGKRTAQAWAFERSDADVFATIDSDTVLDSRALEEGLLPFSDGQVMAVGGVAYGVNHRRSLMTRIIELSFAMSFLSGRAAESAYGAVRVNCGVIAFYRGDVVRKNLDRYLNQTFMGTPTMSGDDRALTFLAREAGKTVFQPTSIAYTALPVKFSHLIAQRLRWARSWFWGVTWLLSRPLNTPEYWLTVLQIISMASYFTSLTLIAVFVISGTITPALLSATLIVSVVIGVASGFRYVIWGRPDVSVWDRLLTWIISPLSTFISMLILTPLYIVALFTLRNKAWGTRKKVEVSLQA